MSALKKIAALIRNCVELYIPVIAFVVLFVIFCYQVFMRYIMRNAQAWTGEVEQMCFLWLVLLGACYAQRERSHVTFTLLYDNLGVKGKAITAMLGNLMITITFLAAAIPSLNWILGLTKRAQVTSMLKVPKTYVFAPYVLFLLIIAIYAIVDIYEEIMVLRGSEKHIRKMLNATKSEVEQAIEAAAAQEAVDLNPDLTGGTGKEDKP